MGLPSLLSSLPRSASASASPLPFCRKLKSNFCFPLSLFSFHRLPPSVASPLFLPWLAASWAGGDGSVISRRQQPGVDTRQTHAAAASEDKEEELSALSYCVFFFQIIPPALVCCVAFPNFSPREACFFVGGLDGSKQRLERIFDKAHVPQYISAAGCGRLRSSL